MQQNEKTHMLASPFVRVSQQYKVKIKGIKTERVTYRGYIFITFHHSILDYYI